MAENADFEAAIEQVVQLSSSPRFYSNIDIEQCLRDGHEGDPAGFALAAAAVAHQGSLAPAAPSVATALAASFVQRPSSRAVDAMCGIADAMWSRGPVGSPVRIHPARVGVPPDSISRQGEIEHMRLSWEICRSSARRWHSGATRAWRSTTLERPMQMLYLVTALPVISRTVANDGLLTLLAQDAASGSAGGTDGAALAAACAWICTVNEVDFDSRPVVSKQHDDPRALAFSLAAEIERCRRTGELPTDAGFWPAAEQALTTRRIDRNWFPWSDGSPAAMVADAIGRLELPRERYVMALTSAIRATEADSEDPQYPTVPDLLLDHLVLSDFFDHLGRLDFLARTDLSEDQQRLVGFLAIHAQSLPATMNLSAAGFRDLPCDLSLLIDATHPLQAEVRGFWAGRGVTWPLWKWYWMAKVTQCSSDERQSLCIYAAQSLLSALGVDALRAIAEATPDGDFGISRADLAAFLRWAGVDVDCA